MKKFCSHLKEADENYSTHFMIALRFSSLLSLAGMICFLHAICPFIFTRTASKLVGKIHLNMQDRVKKRDE